MRVALKQKKASKLNDAEAEAAETQTWLPFAVKCGYLDSATGKDVYAKYDQVLGKLVKMIHNPVPWLMVNR